MVNAKKHKALLDDKETRANNLEKRYYNELKRQDKRRAFLHKHIGKHSIVEAERLDKKGLKLKKSIIFGGIVNC